MAKPAKAGDVLEVVAPGGAIYVHYLGRHADYGDAVRVSPKLHEQRSAVVPELFSDSYVTFYPVAAAVRQGLASVVGYLAPGGLPKRMRRAGARSLTKVETWIIEEGASEVIKRELSDEERKLSIAAIWNHEYLIERVTEGWHPEMEA